MSDEKGGDGKIDLAELEKLDKKLGGVRVRQQELKKLVLPEPIPSGDTPRPGTRKPRQK